MKKLLSLVALLTVIAVAGVAVAGECPLLVKQLNDAKVDPKKADEVKKLTAEAEKLHKDGKHAESVKKAEEAAKVAGLELKRKKAN
jgi:outer membrane murein-binding lipoprotein Lpp